MQLNKYYTPAWEEFYAGFEFESNYMSLSKSGDWEHIQLTTDECAYFFDSYENDAYPTEFRVKYLDQSDLEELGFEYYSYFRDGGTSVFRTSDKEYELHFYRANSIPDIDPDKINIIRHHENPSLKGQIFSGNIKNKSELRKLLKQLNIK